MENIIHNIQNGTVNKDINTKFKNNADSYSGIFHSNINISEYDRVDEKIKGENTNAKIPLNNYYIYNNDDESSGLNMFDLNARQTEIKYNNAGITTYSDLNNNYTTKDLYDKYQGDVYNYYTNFGKNDDIFDQSDYVNIKLSNFNIEETGLNAKNTGNYNQGFLSFGYYESDELIPDWDYGFLKLEDLEILRSNLSTEINSQKKYFKEGILSIIDSDICITSPMIYLKNTDDEEETKCIGKIDIPVKVYVNANPMISFITIEVFNKGMINKPFDFKIKVTLNTFYMNRLYKSRSINNSSFFKLDRDNCEARVFLHKK